MRDAKRFFFGLGAMSLRKRIPSKLTRTISAVVDGVARERYAPTEDDRTPRWRKEVCDRLTLSCEGLVVPEELVGEIRSNIAYAPNFLSVGSRKSLVETITAKVKSAQTRAAAK